jgi:hypothetical protein
VPAGEPAVVEQFAERRAIGHLRASGGSLAGPPLSWHLRASPSEGLSPSVRAEPSSPASPPHTGPGT